MMPEESTVSAPWRALSARHHQGVNFAAAYGVESGYCFGQLRAQRGDFLP
jgi:hypothetical protein